MRAAALLLVALVASGCAFKIGPGEDGWLEYQIWTQANLELEVNPFGSLCLGCLETEADPNGPEVELEEAP